MKTHLPYGIQSLSWVASAPSHLTQSLSSIANDKEDSLGWRIILSLCRWLQKEIQKNTSHRNEVLSQDITHLIQRPCYQRESPCHDPAGNWTTRRPPDDRKETQTAVVWTCLPFFRSSQNYPAVHSDRGKKTRQTEEEVGRQHQGMDRPGISQVPESSGERGEYWKKLVVKLYVVPQRPSRYRARWC